MATKAEDKDSSLIVIDNSIMQSIQNSLLILEEKFDLRWQHQDFQFKNLTETIDDKFRNGEIRLNDVSKKLEKLDARFWQMIMILVTYPIALIFGKICHLF